MENIFNSEWKSADTYPLVNSNGDIIGGIAPGESTHDYLPVMVDRISGKLIHEMTLNPDAFMAELDIE